MKFFYFCFVTYIIMAQIKTEKAYRAALHRIDELLPLVDDEHYNQEDPNVMELDLLSDLVEEYEDIHYPMEKPTLTGMLQLRMYEMGLNQKSMAELLGISGPRMSEIINGKAEPTYSLARTMCQKLNITPTVVLGL